MCTMPERMRETRWFRLTVAAPLMKLRRKQWKSLTQVGESSFARCRLLDRSVCVTIFLEARRELPKKGVQMPGFLFSLYHLSLLNTCEKFDAVAPSDCIAALRLLNFI